MLEKTIVKSIREFLRERGCWSAKNHGTPFTPSGRSDIYACCRGRFVALEVKLPGEQATPLQLRELQEMVAAGAVAAVVHSVEEVGDVLEQAGLGISSETGAR